MLEFGKESVPPIEKQCRNPCLWSYVYPIPVRARTPMPSTAGKLSWPPKGWTANMDHQICGNFPQKPGKAPPDHSTQLRTLQREEEKKRCCSVDMKRDKELFPRNPHKFEINAPLQPIRGSQHSHLQAHTQSKPSHSAATPTLFGEIPSTGVSSRTCLSLQFTNIPAAITTQLCSNSTSYPSEKPKHAENSTSPRKKHLSVCLIVTQP